MGSDIGMQLACFIVETKYEDLPSDVIEFTKGLALKTVAGMTVGSTMPAGRKIYRVMRERRELPDVGVIGCGFKTSLWNAAFSHAFFAHATELEDDKFENGFAWDITTFPLLFPLAEKLRLSGRDFIEASAIGLETDARVCMFYPAHRGLGAVPGAMAPAAAAAKALKLNVGETVAALGMAMSGSDVSFPNIGTDAHFFESSLQCLQGLMSAELAREGLTGNPDIAAYLTKLLGEDNVKPERIVEKLGEEWLFRDIWVKKYPCCFLTHRQIDALLELIGRINCHMNRSRKLKHMQVLLTSRFAAVLIRRQLLIFNLVINMF